MNYVYCLSGMKYFGEMVSRILGWPLVMDGPVGDCDNVFIVGMYDPPYYAHTLKATQRAKHRHIHWCGQDSRLLSKPEFLPDATHTATSELYAANVRKHGIEVHEAVLPTGYHFPVTPLPEQPAITTYYGSNARMYGSSYVSALQDVFPEARFITYHFGQYGEEQLAQIVADTTVSLQVSIGSDGGGCTTREMLEAGRYAISTIPYKHVWVPSDFEHLVKLVRKALKQTEVNQEAADYWKAHNSDEAFLNRLREVGVIE